MKKCLYPFILFILLMAPGLSYGQLQVYDTLRVMTYNTLNYGFAASGGCPALLSYNKHAWLRTVLEYTEPDIIGLEKMAASPASFTADTILQKVLDSVCEACYWHTPFTNASGYDKENMLYYKTSKIGWISTTTIYSGDSNISDINLHRLFYRSPSLAQTHDTIFLNVILVHLESGSGSAAERATEVSGAMSWLNSHVTGPGNYIFMGDLNTQSSSESCYQQIVASTNPNTTFYDPINEPGDWGSQPTVFAHYLTQSTRTTDPGDCGATGGMNDRFDHILCTKDIIDGLDSLQYIAGSYDIIGQDGLHANVAINASPTNTSVPANVLNALYYMSEHLPVMLQLAVGHPTAASGISPEPPIAASQWTYNHLVTDELDIKYQGSEANPASQYTAAIYNLDGQLVSRTSIGQASSIISIASLPEGMYVLQISSDQVPVMNGRFVKVGR